MPPKWSPCRWLIKIVSISPTTTPADFNPISDEAPQAVKGANVAKEPRFGDEQFLGEFLLPCGETIAPSIVTLGG